MNPPAGRGPGSAPLLPSLLSGITAATDPGGSGTAAGGDGGDGIVVVPETIIHRVPFRYWEKEAQYSSRLVSSRGVRAARRARRAFDGADGSCLVWCLACVSHGSHRAHQTGGGPARPWVAARALALLTRSVSRSRASSVRLERARRFDRAVSVPPRARARVPRLSPPFPPSLPRRGLRRRARHADCAPFSRRGFVHVQIGSWSGITSRALHTALHIALHIT